MRQEEVRKRRERGERGEGEKVVRNKFKVETLSLFCTPSSPPRSILYHLRYAEGRVRREECKGDIN